jgi:hypothetical protein
VHHHISPPVWLEAVKRAKLDNPPMANWSPEKSLEDMDKGGVATAMTSPTTPQLGFLSAADAAQIARASNEYARKLANDYPGRFGVFAMLPMPHVDESLHEIDYAFDTLHADGIGMMTSYGDKWLGYSEFQPVFDELNRRKAASDRCGLLREPGARRAGCRGAVWRGYDADDRQPDLLRRVAALCGEGHAGRGGPRAEPVLLRHSSSCQRGDDRSLGEAGAAVADRFRV